MIRGDKNMKKEIDRDTENIIITLSSGRELRPNRGIFGISETTQPGSLFNGYDSTEYVDQDNPWHRPWTEEERRELAEYMISLWEKFGRINR
jgi:hypothetical protein